jgi:peptide/nickel transport system permease protein
LALRILALLPPILRTVYTFWLTITLAFFLLRVLPLDGLTAQLIESGASDAVIAERRAALGLDVPVWVQYGRYVLQVAQGDLGVTLLTGQPVSELIAINSVPTLQLATASLVIGIGLGIPLGLMGNSVRWDGVAQRSWSGAAAWLRDGIIALALSIPAYWAGTVLIWLFAIQLDWLPSSGAGGWQHLVLPSLVLGVATMGGVAVTVSALLAQTVRQDFVRTAHSKGLRERVVMYRHVLRMLLPAVVVYLSNQAVFVLGGTVITEALFARPGMGRLLLDAVLRQDTPIVLGVVVWTGFVVLIVTSTIEVIQRQLDPRWGA